MLRQLLNFIGWRQDPTFGGVARSSQWPKVRAAYLKDHPACAVCGGTKKLNVHHKLPYHLHPELELDPTNFITLCEGNKTINCHLRFGHLDNFETKYNETVEADSALWNRRFMAKSMGELTAK